jgi:hypothetical protein
MDAGRGFDVVVAVGLPCSPTYDALIETDIKTRHQLEESMDISTFHNTTLTL